MNPKYKNRSWLLGNVGRLQYAPIEYWDDHFFVIAAVGRFGADVFLMASQRLQNDPEIISLSSRWIMDEGFMGCQ